MGTEAGKGKGGWRKKGRKGNVTGRRGKQGTAGEEAEEYQREKSWEREKRRMTTEGKAKGERRDGMGGK